LCTLLGEPTVASSLSAIAQKRRACRRTCQSSLGSLSDGTIRHAPALGWPSQNGWVAQRQDASSCVGNRRINIQIHYTLRARHLVPSAPNHPWSGHPASNPEGLNLRRLPAPAHQPFDSLRWSHPTDNSLKQKSRHRAFRESRFASRAVSTTQRRWTPRDSKSVSSRASI